jgi:hypothetical protein
VSVASESSDSKPVIIAIFLPRKERKFINIILYTENFDIFLEPTISLQSMANESKQDSASSEEPSFLLLKFSFARETISTLRGESILPVFVFGVP